MNKLLLTSGLLAALAASVEAAPAKGKPAPQAPKTKPAAAQRYAIVPGKSVGAVKLGATRQSVHKSLGKPKTSALRKDGIRMDEWLGAPVSEKDSWSGKVQTRLAVLFRRDRAVQIELNSPVYRTADGISTNSTLAQFRKKYRPVLRSFLYRDEGGSGYRGYLYDDVKRGLAFTFGAQDMYSAEVLPETLRVHRPGTKALPDPGGEPIVTRDEVPAGKSVR